MNTTLLFSFMGAVAAMFAAVMAAREILKGLRLRAREDERNAIATEENTLAVQNLTRQIAKIADKLNNIDWRLKQLERLR